MALNPRLSRISAMSYTTMTKLLIVRTCAIGDFVLNFPSLIALQKIYPNARFTLVGNPGPLELTREFIPVENVYSIELPPWSHLFYEAVADLEFDLAIVWMKDPVVAENLRLSGIPSVMRADPFPTSGHAADHLCFARRGGRSRTILSAQIHRRCCSGLSCNRRCPAACRHYQGSLP